MKLVVNGTRISIGKVKVLQVWLAHTRTNIFADLPCLCKWVEFKHLIYFKKLSIAFCVRSNLQVHNFLSTQQVVKYQWLILQAVYISQKPPRLYADVFSGTLDRYLNYQASIQSLIMVIGV